MKSAQLVVHFNKEGYRKTLIVAPIMIVAMVVILTIYSRMSVVFPGWPLLTALIFYFILAVKIFFYIGIAFFSFMFLIGILYAPFFLGYKGPAAILDENGIWVKNYNFIPWKDIGKFDLFSIGSAPKSLGIWVKDRNALSKQSTFTGKVAIFWTKIFNTPHISLGNLDTDYETILVFAHRHLKG